MSPKEAIEFLKKHAQIRRRLDGLRFWAQHVESTDDSEKRAVLLVSEQVEKDLAPIIENAYNLVTQDGDWMQTLLHHIEHIEGENRELWDELQKGDN